MYINIIMISTTTINATVGCISITPVVPMN